MLDIETMNRKVEFLQHQFDALCMFGNIASFTQKELKLYLEVVHDTKNCFNNISAMDNRYFEVMLDAVLKLCRLEHRLKGRTLEFCRLYLQMLAIYQKYALSQISERIETSPLDDNTKRYVPEIVRSIHSLESFSERSLTTLKKSANYAEHLTKSNEMFNYTLKLAESFITLL